MKPVSLIEHALHNSSRPRDVVLDPYSGAGSTMIARCHGQSITNNEAPQEGLQKDSEAIS